MGGLSFLSPWFLGGALAVGVPILLHLFARQTATEVRFPATRFVPSAPVEFVRRKHVTDLLLLLLRCAALMLLAMAFARPYLSDRAAGAQGPVNVVAIDTSFSMAAASTWRAAQAEALEVIDATPSGGRVGLVAFDDGGRVLLPATADLGAARKAVADLRAGAGATSFAAAAPAALDVLAGRAGTLTIVTDRQRVGLDGAIRLPDNVQVKFGAVPAAAENLAVSDVSLGGNAIDVTVTNGGLTERQTEVTLQVDGEVVARRPASLPGGGATTVRFDGARRPSGVAVARVSDDAGLPADDERTLVLDPPPGVRVLSIVAAGGSQAGGFYVRRALEASPRSQPVALRELVLPAADQGAVADPVRPDVIVLLATRGLGRPAREQLTAAVRAGTGLLVASGPDVEAGVLKELLGDESGLRVEQLDGGPGSLSLAPVDVRHAVFAPYADRAGAFSRVRFAQAVRIAHGDASRVLARFDNGLPALAEQALGEGRVLLLASDLDARWNEWPLSPTFVPFLREAVAYLGHKAPLAQEYLVGHAPAAVGPAPGVHVLEDGRRIAVNVDPRESSLDLAEGQELVALVAAEPAKAAADERRDAESREAQQSLWRYVLLGMVLMLVAESAMTFGRAVRA